MKQGWEMKTLGEVCENIFAGGDKPKEFSKYKTDEFSVPIFSNGEKNKGLYGYTNIAKINKPSITISGRGTIGYSEIRTEPFVPIVRLITLLPNDETIDIHFFHYGIKNIDFSNSGSSIPQLTVPMVKGYSIPLPPLPEQQRIVAILDKAFTAIATEKENAQQNLLNAKELFESYLQGVFENNKWSKTTLSQITDDISDEDHIPPPKTETGIPFITISNINKETCSINFSKTFYVSTDYFENIKSKRKPKKGDVLYTVTGSYGIPVLIESDFDFCFQRHIGLLRPKKDINSKWLFYWVLSPQALKQANETATGTAQRTVSLKALRNFIAPKTPIKEQNQIAIKLNSLSSKTKKLEGIYQQKINDLEELKKSVLNKAFRGELMI